MGGVWGGAVPSPVGGLGACSQKKKQFCAKNYAILSKFWYFFPIVQHKNFQRIRESRGGGLYRPKSGGTYPLSPLLRRLWPKGSPLGTWPDFG